MSVAEIPAQQTPSFQSRKLVRFLEHCCHAPKRGRKTTEDDCGVTYFDNAARTDKLHVRNSCDAGRQTALTWSGVTYSPDIATVDETTLAAPPVVVDVDYSLLQTATGVVVQGTAGFGLAGF